MDWVAFNASHVIAPSFCWSSSPKYISAHQSFLWCRSHHVMSQSAVAIDHLFRKVMSNIEGLNTMGPSCTVYSPSVCPPKTQWVYKLINGAPTPNCVHVLAKGNTLVGNKTPGWCYWCFVSFPSTLLIVMLITWVVRRRLTEEDRFFRVESGSSAKDVRLLSIWRFVLEPEKYINIKISTHAKKY